MSLPKISVVVPSFNKVDFIEETLNSVVSQNYPNLEVIVQDGNSTDGTLSIIKKFAKDYPKLISWESENDKGQTDAINKGMKKANGKVLSFLNADDTYEKGALNAVGEYFVAKPDTSWLAGRGRVIDAEGREIAKLITWYKNLFLSLNLNSSLLIFNYLMQPSVFISKSAYNKHGPFIGTKKAVLEYDLWLKLGENQMPAVLTTYLSRFRLLRDNISSTLFRSVLSEDYKIALQYTKNPIILFLHYIHNLGRVASLFYILFGIKTK